MTEEFIKAFRDYQKKLQEEIADMLKRKFEKKE